MPKRGYARILESYRSSPQSEIQVRSRSVPSGYSTYLETSEENRVLAQRHAFARWRNNRDALMLRYARVPSNLPTSCDGCSESKKFDVNHALDCKKGGLVTARLDEISDELRDLLAHVLSPFRIRCESMINPALMLAMVPKRMCQVLPPRLTF